MLGHPTRAKLLFGAEVLIVAAVYFACGWFGLSLASIHKSASAVWPPTGLALSILLMRGRRLWPAVFLGAFVVNILKQGTFATSLGVATGNTLEALVGVWCVEQVASGRRVFDQTVDIFKFVFLTAMVSTTISPTIGLTSLCLGGFGAWNQYWMVWLTWWLGDMVSNLIFAPLLILWWRKENWGTTPKKLLEGGALLLLTSWIGQMVFLGQTIFGRSNYPLEYLAIPPILWAAFRFGERGSVTCAFVMCGIALWGTRHQLGPFVRADPNESLLLLQAFMGTITVTGLVLASIISEQQRAEQRLQVQDAVSRVLAEAPALREAAPRILHALCATGRWDVGAIWRVDEAGNVLACVDLWHIQNLQVDAFEQATRSIRFAPGVGLPGQAWSAGKPVFFRDVTTDPTFPRAPLAGEAKLRSAFCFPLKLGEEILGVIECFSREVREPDPNFLKMLEAIGAQLGQFIERRRAEAEQRKSQQALEKAEAALRQHTETLEKRVQERTAKLEEIVQSLDGFCYSIAHDLRAPLRAMVGFSKALVEDYGEKLDETASGYIQRIKSSATRMDDLILDLLKLGRVNTAELPCESVDTTKVAEKSVALLEEEIRKRDANVKLTEPLLPVRANAVMVEQVLTNLLANALKFSRRGCRPEIEIRTEVRNGSIRVCVQDNGIGIKLEHAGKLFQPFVRLVNGDEFPGTGIGLAIVRKGIERMGGTVGVESDLAKGSCFWFELPTA
jgi:signal transduction histidine kinase/integral membrane sensor domain MASE1